MAKVSLKDIRALEKEINKPEVVEYQGLTIEVKGFISASQKSIIIDLVVQNSILELEKVYDSHIRNVIETYLITKYYTNINLNESPMEMYDLLVPTGIYEAILHHIPSSEKGYLKRAIDHRIEEEKNRLIREGTFVGVLEKLVDSIDIDKINEVINGFDPKVLEHIPNHDLELIKNKLK